MKLNIQVDLEWLDEDGSIDDLVQSEIINGVKRSISATCLAKVEKEASKKIDKAIDEAIAKVTQSIEGKAIAFADEWLENEVTVTDKWGDPTDRLTIRDLVKKSFDKTLERQVDKSGKFSDGYGYDRMTLIQYLGGAKVEEVVSAKLKDFNEQIDDQITKAVNAGIRENVANKFAEMVVATAKHNNQVAQIGKDQ